jgi:hypothetical protein
MAITAGVLAAAGCSSSPSSGSSSPGPAARPSSSPPGSQGSGSQGSPGGSLPASQAVQQAAQNAGQVTSFAATVNVRTAGTATSTIAGTLEQRTGADPLLVANFGSVTAQGQTIPGGIQEILDSSAVYLKLAQLAQATGKPWIKIPASEMSQIAGGSLGQLLQNNSSNPLLQTQMLASSTNVKKVGTTTLNGVPVTEYTGTYPISAGLAKLPADLRSKVAQQLQAMGLQTENFQIWLDHSQQVRKVITSAQGSKEQVTSTIGVTAVNEPVSVAIPPASQTATVPASELGASGQAKPGTS